MTDQRISPEELNRKLADPSIDEKELARYFLLDEERSRGFQPALRLNPDTVLLPNDPDVARARSDAAMTFANTISRYRRLMRFEHMRTGAYTGPIIVSEGDSWFQYPLLLDDIIDHLYSSNLAVRSLDAAGDTLENMLREREYIDAIGETGASIFLLSAGGNDALGGGNLRAHLRDFDPVLSPSAHLLPSFDQLLDHTLAMYERVLREVEALPDVVTICHGYDFVIPNNGKWLDKPMRSRGIDDAAFQRAIVKQMIDAFNERLRLLIARFGVRAVHVDARYAVGATANEWYDELHPKDDGFGRVAERFVQAINQVVNRARPAALSGGRGISATGARSLRSATVTARHGRSLHIGMNKIDSVHYGEERELFGCHFDAEDMAQLAREHGFESTVLLDAEGTRDAVKKTIEEAAGTLKAGDLFLFSYAGHGSQVPDFNSDESDSADETLCLFDGMLIDDELYELWSRFADDVRIVMISDSCHSGTVLRTARRMPAVTASADTNGTRSRLLPMHIAARTFRTHRDFYTTLGRQRRTADERLLVRELDMPLRSSVLLLSGCQDNQESQDGVGNGRFTQELLAVWDEGRFTGDWHQLHRRIVAGMPPTQTPNLMLLGRNPQALASLPPFVI